jgi:hypothetical protein
LNGHKEALIELIQKLLFLFHHSFHFISDVLLEYFRPHMVLYMLMFSTGAGMVDVNPERAGSWQNRG